MGGFLASPTCALPGIWHLRPFLGPPPTPYLPCPSQGSLWNPPRGSKQHSVLRCHSQPKCYSRCATLQACQKHKLHLLQIKTFLHPAPAAERHTVTKRLDPLYSNANAGKGSFPQDNVHFSTQAPSLYHSIVDPKNISHALHSHLITHTTHIPPFILQLSGEQERR